MNRGPVLEMRGICKEFPGVRALSNVSLSVLSGEVHALVGENGAGKSTLMRILAGALQKDSGEIILEGCSVQVKSPADALALGITVIHQELSLMSHLSAAENLFMGRYPKKRSGLIDYGAMHVRANTIIHDLGMDFDSRTRIRNLRIAERQVVEIAKARIGKAKVLVLDEPSAVLGRQDVVKLFDLIRRLRDVGVGIVYISHRLEEIFEIADHITVLKDGELVGTYAAATLDTKRLVKLMIGREIKGFRSDMAGVPAEAPVALAVQGLSRKGVFDNINFEVHSGEIVGLAGLVGSGRTEIVRAIFAADPKDGGKIEVSGKSVTVRDPSDAVRAGIGLVPENRKEEGLLLSRSVAENIVLPRLRAYTRGGLINTRRVNQVSEGLVGQIAIKTPSVQQPVRLLSGGNQQKVVFAKWINSGCRVLIVDEATRGVDVGAKTEMYQLLNQLRGQGAAILMIASDVSEILGMCDRVIVIQRGRIAGTFGRAELDQNPSLVETIVEVGNS
jgi:ribose transport system ATP-binding protein